MARTIQWPIAALPVPDAPALLPPTLLEALDRAGFSSALGPELSRLFGTRISARPNPTPPQPGKAPAKMLAVGRVRISTPAGPVSMDLAIEATAATILIERLFGSRPADASGGASDQLTPLPPGSASWISLCRFLTTAITKAMAAAGHASAGPPALPARAADPATPEGATCLLLGLDIDGAQGSLLLIDPSSPAPIRAPEPPPLPDPQLWRRRTHARSLQVELPVALRIADTRLLLSDVAALRPGDVIPLERPRALGVLIAGQRFSDIPAHRLLTANPEEPEV